MEEEPTAVAPDLEAEKEFIIKAEKPETTVDEEQPEPLVAEKPQAQKAPEADENDEFDLSDITHAPSELSREEIIAAAEAAAYNE